MTRERFEEWLRSQNRTGEMIVKINYKYDFEKKYTEENEHMEWDGIDIIWLNDWDEGQEDVIIIGYTWVDEVEIKHIF